MTGELQKTSQALRVGDVFSPYKRFKGIFIPDAIVRSGDLSPGEKIAWGRLARYVGNGAFAFPSMATLGKEIGVGARQARKYVAALEQKKLLQSSPRFSDNRQTSNRIEFLWHKIFELQGDEARGEEVNDRSGGGENNCSGDGGNDRSYEESPGGESQFKEKSDLDYPPTNRKERDSRVANHSHSKCKQYPRLREALADYMATPEDPDRGYPSDRLVVDVMDAAYGATEEQVIECLRYLREKRGLLPGTKQGPRRFRWFKTVVADYFKQKQFREMVFSPSTKSDAGIVISRDEFESMMEAF